MPAKREHEAIRVQLATYATFAVLGQQPDVQLPAVAAHLPHCPQCQEELQELMELVTAAYTDQVTHDPVCRTPDLTFLDLPAAAPRENQEPEG